MEEMGHGVGSISHRARLEDWKKYEISFKLLKQGAMKHMSGASGAVNVENKVKVGRRGLSSKGYVIRNGRQAFGA